MLVNNDNNSTVAVVCILYSGMMLCVVCLYAALTASVKLPCLVHSCFLS